jgi:hypothetical protein
MPWIPYQELTLPQKHEVRILHRDWPPDQFPNFEFPFSTDTTIIRRGKEVTIRGRLRAERVVHFRWTDQALDREIHDAMRETEACVQAGARSKGDLLGFYRHAVLDWEQVMCDSS